MIQQRWAEILLKLTDMPELIEQCVTIVNKIAIFNPVH